MKHRLFLDESGDHFRTHPEDIGQRYLGLVGVVFRLDDYEQFSGQLENFKRKHLAYDVDEPPVLHREDILNKRGAFSVLADPERCRVFDHDLLALVERTRFRLIAVVLDKLEHGKKKYRRVRHPYQYCMEAMMERYCGWLRFIKGKGDVLAESRGASENRALEEVHESIHDFGTRYLPTCDAESTLTTKRIKIKRKAENIAGLQLADLLAHPMTRDVLVAYHRISDHGSRFAGEIARIAEPKYNRKSYEGRINGYGRVILA